MSTGQRLDPTIRRSRRARRDLLTHLEKQVQELRRVPALLRAPFADFCLTALKLLREVHDSPWRSGEAKNAIFTRVAREYREHTGMMQS